MSGLEALGALASAAQVAAYVVKVAAFLSDVCEKLKHAPERIRQHAHQIERLIDIILHIKENPSLHTQLIFAQLDSIITQAYSLQALLGKLLSQYTQSSFRRRYWKALKGEKEKQVLAALQNLEREKTGLSLCLTASQTEFLHNVGREARMAESNTHSKVLLGPSLDPPFAQAPSSSAPIFLNGERAPGNETQLILFRRGLDEEPGVVEMQDEEGPNAEKANVKQCDACNDSKKGGCIIENPISIDESSQINAVLGSIKYGGTIHIKKPRSEGKSLQINGLISEGYPLAKLIGRNV